MGNNFVSNSNANSLISKIAQRLGLRPKTWTGTQSDWANLDPSVQAEYEYVNFTDDYAPTQIITWDDWNALTPQQQAAIPEAEIINAPGVDGALKASILKLLWTNPSPNSDFANQNITASISDSILNYKFFVLTYKKYSSDTMLKTMIIPLGSSNLEWDEASNTTGVDVVKRGVVFSAVNGSVVINNAVVYSSVSQAVVNNSKIIPLTIYGIKDSIELKFDAIASNVSTAADHCMMPDGVTNVVTAINNNATYCLKYRGVTTDCNAVTDLSIYAIENGAANVPASEFYHGVLIVLGGYNPVQIAFSNEDPQRMAIRINVYSNWRII